MQEAGVGVLVGRRGGGKTVVGRERCDKGLRSPVRVLVGGGRGRGSDAARDYKTLARFWIKRRWDDSPVLALVDDSLDPDVLGLVVRTRLKRELVADSEVLRGARISIACTKNKDGRRTSSCLSPLSLRCVPAVSFIRRIVSLSRSTVMPERSAKRVCADTLISPAFLPH